MQYPASVKKIKNIWLYVAVGVLAILLTLGLLWVMNRGDTSNNPAATGHATMATEEALEEHGITPLTAPEASNNAKTADELAYLLEEEKLAHDVYVAMYDRWGSRVFNNIKNSETMHQNMVWAVMESRGLSDTRRSDPGKFTNPDLQKLYDELIARGNQNAQEAFKVGVTVEEVDIADLKKTLAALDPKDTDVKDVLENLLHGSENHLRAFNRQANR